MESVTLENFRCFREKQTVKLAPLTLLVGENSTGKTSFLALVQALTEYAYERREPTFKKDPFDLGTFEEIVHSQSDDASVLSRFSAGMTANLTSHPRSPRDGDPTTFPASLDLTFSKPSKGTVPALVRQRVTTGSTWVDEATVEDDTSYRATLHTERGEWEFTGSTAAFGTFALVLRIYDVFNDLSSDVLLPDYPVKSVGDSPQWTVKDIRQLRKLDFLREAEFAYKDAFDGIEAIAPVRTKPDRSYNPSSISIDSEGDYLASYLADLVYREDLVWPQLKKQLEDFGKRSGLFDVVEVHRLGHDASSPFQIRVGINNSGQQFAVRNLPDVGYGVSQALPILAALLRPDGAAQVLLQQPEVHLHPSAQAELGSLFCEVVTQGKQLLVETHSDHLIDRIRMDVRDGKTSLTPEDVRILYFERVGLDVKIHEIWYDEYGNLENVPPSYRRFFMEEVDRSIWPPD